MQVNPRDPHFRSGGLVIMAAAFPDRRCDVSDVGMTDTDTELLGAVVVQHNTAVLSHKYGLKKFVKACDENVTVKDAEEDAIVEEDGTSTKLFYDETVNVPELSKKNKKRKTARVKVETIELSDSSDDELEMVDTAANKELLAAVQAGDWERVGAVKYCDYNCRYCTHCTQCINCNVQCWQLGPLYQTSVGPLFPEEFGFWPEKTNK